MVVFINAPQQQTTPRSLPTIIRARRTALLSLAAAGASLLVALIIPSAQPPFKVRVVINEPAQVLDDSGAEMTLVTLTITRPAQTAWAAFRQHGTTIEINLAGNWIQLPNTLSAGDLAAGQSKPEVLLLPNSAERCRFQLDYAGISPAWRFGGWLSQVGLKLPPTYWAWAGWPQPEGRTPHWKRATFDLPLEPPSPTTP